jgi:2-dehydropantoate 2-reductase
MTMAPSMKASMARDFERGGRTELDALTGGLLRLAEARGIDVPATRVTYAILKLREQLNNQAATPAGMGVSGAGR